MKCLGCPYYTGVQCHGHGEYWGNCMLVDMAYKSLDSRTLEDEYISSGMRDIRFDNSDCLFISYGLFELKKFKK